ncbi:MAG TPA: ferritin-like domain-containing protein [Polyangiaceae bacterium]|jgi:rubrerythrin
MSFSLDRWNTVLARVIGAALPLVTACGTTTNNADAGDANDEPVVGCGGCGCTDSATPSDYATTYDLCAQDDAGLLDASADADADGTADGGVCFASCALACQAAAPKGEFATCLGETDAGESRTAQCESTTECTGRRPAGLVDAHRMARAGSLGEALARSAWLEAASVHAFRRLARELRAYGAPSELVHAARTAARDEIRHARAMRALATRYGAIVPKVAVIEDGARDLEAIARENAVEGCVSETFGAVLGAFQAEHATDPDIAAALLSIAPDELRHAALAWAVAEWIEPRLSAEARARVERARVEVTTTYLHNTHILPAPPVASALGLPTAAGAHTLARALVDEKLWRRVKLGGPISER